MDTVQEGKNVLIIERDAVDGLIGRLGDEFVRAVDLLAGVRGRIIITGIGKSGIVARKITATLSSTGSPAVFLNSAEGLHGDIGVVTADDVVLALSYSGQSEEVLKLIPYFRWMSVPIIAMTGVAGSALARESDIVLDIRVDKEACPWDIVPTASTTAAMALGDALAVTLLKRKGIDLSDFAHRHPGGAIGRQILLSVGDLMHSGDRCPKVDENVLLSEAIYEMTGKGLGMTTVTGKGGALIGVITDGDLRRVFQKYENPLSVEVGRLMGGSPKSIRADKLAAEALRILEDHAITSLVITDNENRPVGVIHIHDILKAGITL
ncbi:MAG: KpsF/GutQ family sugar-phosphate isomerase [Deltaproteobacteria bacterium]|nr:KpsF/GutQ family sugar-phosphate isomerase [Candidatus Zymogenaceae bacterium]